MRSRSITRLKLGMTGEAGGLSPKKPEMKSRSITRWKHIACDCLNDVVLRLK